jgi:hypothetical protein
MFSNNRVGKLRRRLVKLFRIVKLLKSSKDGKAPSKIVKLLESNKYGKAPGKILKLLKSSPSMEKFHAE